ncbi:hypothetical protein MASR2M39_26400 [Ignavibacteriales bacterium]
MMGFTETEVLEMINGTFEEPGKLNINQIVVDIRAWYNGSRFQMMVRKNFIILK